MLKTRVIVAGGRDFNDYNVLVKSLVSIFMEKKLATYEVEVVSGNADGADKLGESFAHSAKAFGTTLKVMKADWDKLGDSAGYIRNLEMALYARSSINGICVCFWDGNSDGTKHMIDIAKKENLELYVFNYEGERINA